MENISLSLTQLVLYVGLAAALITLIVGLGYKKHKSWIMTFLQNFTGVLFIFSGYVKAIDPLGTAYKMKDYFSEFQYTFEGTWFSFISPIFPFFSNYASWFSVGMIVFEIVLGIMLLLGMKSKLTSWLFLLLVAFFTILTGYTYLTGYVPDGVNFFEFGKWTDYKASNMKVTDCGCFGDFIKLDPKISFFKDLALLVPAFFFIYKHKDMHQLFTKNIRKIIVGVATLGVFFYCLSNYVWDIPGTDFRPFKKGRDIAAVKLAEEEAEANVRITDWIIKNEKSGETLTLPSQEYFSKLKTYNKQNGWSVTDQIKTEPAIKPTKISEFEIKDFEDNGVNYEYLEGEKPNFMIVSHKMYGDQYSETLSYQDTTFVMDTVEIAGVDEPLIVKAIGEIKTAEKNIVKYNWDKSWMNDFESKIKSLAENALANDAKLSIVFGDADMNAVVDFAQKSGIKADYYTADGILLKTIVRSNPGIVLWNDGTIVDKWHKNKLPNWETLKALY